MKHTHTAVPATIMALMASFATHGAGELNVSDYQDELQRCVNELRPDLDLRDGDRVFHIVDSADRNGNWYRFDMETTVTDEDGIVVLDRLEVECRAHRTDGRTQLILDRAPSVIRTARR